MKPAHALVLVAAVAIATVAGTYAALRTTQLSAASAQPFRVDEATVAAQNRALDRAEAALRAQLRRKPPALPPVPSAPAGPAIRAAAPPSVVYVRPKPIVRVIHRHGAGEHESEGGDGAGAGLDD
jgi:hypothetical protein